MNTAAEQEEGRVVVHQHEKEESGADTVDLSVASTSTPSSVDENLEKGAHHKTQVMLQDVDDDEDNNRFQQCMERRSTKILAIVSFIGAFVGIFIWLTDGEFCDFGRGGGGDSSSDSGFTGGYSGE